MDTTESSKESSTNSSQPAPVAAKPEAPKQELKMPINLDFRMPTFKMPEGGLLVFIKNKIREYKRVYQITKKPDRKEYSATVKASGLGIAVIGMLGFIIAMIVQALQMLK